jgi:hypothetical protein
MQAVSLAFATLGPKARPALSELDALVSVAHSDLLNISNGRDRWNLTLARIGKPIEELKWFSGRPEADVRDRENLRRRLERFDPKLVWNY